MTEKEYQIPLMAEIYAKATNVLVWLGEQEDDGDLALEAVRDVGKGQDKSIRPPLVKQQILNLLQRPWFQRVWVSEKLIIENSSY
jgi:hypothetical protein